MRRKLEPLPDRYPREYWEEGAGSNYVNYGDDSGWPLTVGLMQPWLPGGGELLEVACAKGFFVAEARRQGIKASGIDLSEYAIQHCAPAARPYLEHGDASNLPWKDDAFATVCSWEFLEHVPESHLDAVLSEMERVAAPGATQWHRIGTLDDPALLEEHLHDHTHVTNEPATWWRELLESRGWERIPRAEERLDRAFASRDWSGRFFVYRLDG